jgi:hypothetical protein
MGVQGKTSSDLIVVFRVAVEEGLDLQLVHPATQRTSESSLAPKVEMAEPLSQEIQEFGGSPY